LTAVLESRLTYDYRTLSSAESALEEATTTVGAVKLAVVKIVGCIRERELYKQYRNPQTDQECKSLDEYLKLRNDQLQRVSGMGGRTIMRRYKAYSLLCEQLDYPDDIFLDLGEHAVILSEAANTDRDLLLQEQDAESPHGGRYLGYSAYRELVEATRLAVAGGEWKVKDTKTEVNAILGKKTEEKPEWFAECHTVFGDEDDPSAERVRVDRLGWLCEGVLIEFELKGTVDYETLRLFASRSHIRVDGLGDSFNDVHLH
jgi:hypothetical protein